MGLRVNDKVKQSKFKRLLVISIIMAIGGYYLYFQHLFKQDRDFGFVETENITMDYTIYPSTIPENQLLRIEEAD